MAESGGGFQHWLDTDEKLRRVALPETSDGVGGGGVAGDDDGIALHSDERLDGGFGERPDLFGRFAAVGDVLRVAHVAHLAAGKEFLEFSRDVFAAATRIKHADFHTVILARPPRAKIEVCNYFFGALKH